MDYFELEAIFISLFPPVPSVYPSTFPFLPIFLSSSPFFFHRYQHFSLFYRGILPNPFAPSLTRFRRTKCVMPLASVAVLYDLVDSVRLRLQSWQTAVLKPLLWDLVALWRLVYTCWVCQHQLHSPPYYKDCVNIQCKGGKVCQTSWLVISLKILHTIPYLIQIILIRPTHSLHTQPKRQLLSDVLLTLYE